MMTRRSRIALVTLAAVMTLAGCADGRPSGECGLIGDMKVRDVEPVEDGYGFRVSAEEWKNFAGLTFNEQDSATVFVHDVSAVVILDECPDDETEDTDAEALLDSIEAFDPDSNDPFHRLRETGKMEDENNE